MSRTPSTEELKDRILLALEPHVDAIAAELATLVPELAREQVEAARAQLGGSTPTRAKKSTAAIGGKAKRTVTCRKCGETGHIAKTCKKKTTASKIVVRPVVSPRGDDTRKDEGAHRLDRDADRAAGSNRRTGASPVVSATPQAPPPHSLRPFRCHRGSRRAPRRCQAGARAASLLLHSIRTRTDATSFEPCRT